MYAVVFFSALLATTSSDSTVKRFHGLPVSCRKVSGEIDAIATHVKPTLNGLRIRGSGNIDGDLPGVVVRKHAGKCGRIGKGRYQNPVGAHRIRGTSVPLSAVL